MLIITVAFGGLENPCLPDNQCNDANAGCSGGLCRCKETHFVKNRICSMCGNIILLQSSKILLTKYIRFEVRTRVYNCVVSVSKLGLNAACGTGDQCLDHSASCRDRACRCEAEFFDKGGVCRK